MRKHSFTLIEMLIVVVIIGILAAALIPRLQSVQARARDTKRKADLHQIATALAIYKEDNWWYKWIHDETNYFDWQDNIPITDAKHQADYKYRIMWDYAEYDWPIYDILARYMTSIPQDPTINTAWQANGINIDIYWYLLGILPKHKANTNDSTKINYDSMMLAARTESDWSSSNWVINLWAGQNYQDNKPNYNGDPGMDWNIREGTLWWWDTDRWWYFCAQAYQDFLCNKVVADTWERNDGQWNCRFNKNLDELRYLYVQ